MSEPFLGQITIFGFNFAPRSWALCDGQVLPINQNQALFSLLGTTFGGDGQTTFALPDLRGRTPLHQGTGPGLSSRPLGSKGGEQTHALTTTEIPNHTHAARASSADGNAPVPTNNVLAAANNAYRPPDNLTALQAGTLATTGTGQGHENMQPYLTLSFCIALMGVFPSRN